MPRPLWLDIATAVAPLAGGVTAFLLGRTLSCWRTPMQRAAAGVLAALVAVVALSLLTPLPDPLPRILARLGGGTVLLVAAAVFVLGAARNAPGSRFSPRFLGLLAGVCGLLLAVEGGGRLGWRVLAPDTWTRAPGPDGCLRQSSGLTCGPTAAAMLLHANGVPTTEGEMAYLAGTSVFGTDAWSLAEAVAAKLGPPGAEVAFPGFDTLAGDGRPFVAHVRRPEIGGHAVFVEAVGPAGVRFIDPLDGSRRTVSADAFRAEWDGTAVRVSRTP